MSSTSCTGYDAMSVKLVMGAQRASLEKLEKFGGENGTVIFPHFITGAREHAEIRDGRWES